MHLTFTEQRLFVGDLELTDDMCGEQFGLTDNVTIILLRKTAAEQSAENKDQQQQNNELMEQHNIKPMAQQEVELESQQQASSITPAMTQQEESIAQQGEKESKTEQPIDIESTKQILHEMDTQTQSLLMQQVEQSKQMLEREKEILIQQFQSKIEQHAKDEKARLARLWSQEKRDILRKANEDRQELMLENSRLRKELSAKIKETPSDGVFLLEENDALKAEIAKLNEQLLAAQGASMNKKLSEEQENMLLQFDAEKKQLYSVVSKMQEDNARINREKQKLEQEKTIILQNWSEDIEILKQIHQEEKQELLQEKEMLTKRLEENLISLQEADGNILLYL